MNLTQEELWEEWRAWQIFHTPPPEPPSVEDAWLEAVAAGQYAPDDYTARAAFIAQWKADHPDEPEDDWEPVDAPPPRPLGGEDPGSRNSH
ncbi:hypothetical protein [Sulfobacillus harzensis]|uniref:Uncharacterized protein n=1 Tax=Sulfobacillus harzensis TaxID=2729629 RepID=A0A7Y0KZY2_9FIRM|nr:hypothetical protein [Sulfobacillus harzensis]NMP20774.1 hypothetical protein [Sulfobacillus harzensis]